MKYNTSIIVVGSVIISLLSCQETSSKTRGSKDIFEIAAKKRCDCYFNEGVFTSFNTYFYHRLKYYEADGRDDEYFDNKEVSAESQKLFKEYKEARRKAEECYTQEMDKNKELKFIERNQRIDPGQYYIQHYIMKYCPEMTKISTAIL